jgi:hypothetical protein
MLIEILLVFIVGLLPTTQFMAKPCSLLNIVLPFPEVNVGKVHHESALEAEFFKFMMQMPALS